MMTLRVSSLRVPLIAVAMRVRLLRPKAFPRIESENRRFVGVRALKMQRRELANTRRNSIRNLDLSKLEDFYAKFDPKNHREKILIFAVFMRDILKKAPCAADDIFSCYRTLKDQTEIPEAFLQAIRDTQNKGGYVELVSPTEIKITIAGENYFNKKLGRREAAK